MGSGLAKHFCNRRMVQVVFSKNRLEAFSRLSIQKRPNLKIRFQCLMVWFLNCKYTGNERSAARMQAPDTLIGGAASRKGIHSLNSIEKRRIRW